VNYRVIVNFSGYSLTNSLLRCVLSKFIIIDILFVVHVIILNQFTQLAGVLSLC